MGYVVFSFALAVGVALMFVAITDINGIMTKVFATKKPMSLGIKAISGSVRQLRFWYFLMGALAVLLSVVGIISLANTH